MPTGIQLDPTRTLTLRRQYEAEMKRRFFALRKLVVEAIGTLDVLGLDESNQPVNSGIDYIRS